jgi:hypothetical protein
MCKTVTYRVRLWQRHYRWLWLDRLLGNGPLMDREFETMTEALQAARDRAVGALTTESYLHVLMNEVKR